MQPSTSQMFSLNSIDWKKVGIGASVAIGGAFFTYFEQILMQVDFGQFAPLVMAANSILVNIVRKWLTDHTY